MLTSTVHKILGSTGLIILLPGGGGGSPVESSGFIKDPQEPATTPEVNLISPVTAAAYSGSVTLNAN